MAMSSRLANRLSAARRAVFVGRTDEQNLFVEALAAPELPFFVLYIHGPGGVGKTTLLRVLADLAEQQHIPTAQLDGRNIDASPEGLGEALCAAMQIGPGDSPADSMAAQPGRFVLFIDTYELLAPLDPWLRESFLPDLPENVLVVLAGRTPPANAWQSDSGWRSLLRVVSLRNLSPNESLSLLEKRGVPQDQRPVVLDFTHGHPLALALVADAFAQRSDFVFQPEQTPDIVKTLLEQFVQKAPGPAHRAALEASSLVRVMTETLLAEMLTLPHDPAAANDDASHELFEWLRGLSFIESRPGGLYPHDLARDALAADLRWRNPDWYATLHSRSRAYYTRRINQTGGEAQQRALLDLVFLHRDNPAVRPFYDWQVGGGALSSALQESDVAELVQLTAKHEGEASAKLAEYWFRRFPAGTRLWRDGHEQLAGFLTYTPLHEATEADRAADPAIAAAWQFLQQQAPLRSGESALYFRFWMAADAYQSVSPIQSLIFINIVRHYLITPGLAYTFFAVTDPTFWAMVLGYADLHRLAEADFEVGGRRYGVYGHDWRVRPPLAWLALLAEREVAAQPQTDAPPEPAPALVVLSRPSFEAAVQDALRYYTRPDRLAGNPLLRARLVVTDAAPAAGDGQRSERLRQRIQAAAEMLKATSRDEKLYRALDRTYFHPAPTQEAAAEALDLPFSTYRRHLKAGQTEITTILWQWEIGGA